MRNKKTDEILSLGVAMGKIEENWRIYWLWCENQHDEEPDDEEIINYLDLLLVAWLRFRDFTA